MGSVFLAERQHRDFTQQVAIKIIRGRFVVNDLVRRFDAERKILARLNHPYIASLIDGGTSADGFPYLVMEYVEGVPVDTWLDEQRVDIRGRVEMICKIAQAVQAAHQNLIVHRDLKPSNVLITADGIPKLLDFGIAKLLDAEQDAASGETTMFGNRALTPDYASPEQILENRVTTASDVYSLGVLGYQLLAGCRPYSVDRGSPLELASSMEKVTVPPASTRVRAAGSGGLSNDIAAARRTTPERLRKALSGDLDNVLMKALQRQPGDRYVSVDAFSADLRRFLDGEPVSARPLTVGYRVGRFIARNRLAVGSAAAVVFLLVTGLAATGWSYLQAEAARAEATTRFEQVRALARRMMFDVYDDIAGVPGTTSARQTLAATAQEYLATLAASPNSPDEVVLDAAQGYARLSAILNRQAVEDDRDRDAAAAAWDNAEALLTDLAGKTPDNAAVFHTLGQLLSRRGADLTYIDNDPGAARAILESAIEHFDTALNLAPDASIAAERLGALERIADTYKWQNDYATTQTQTLALLEEIDTAQARWPGEPLLLQLEGETYQLRGEAGYFLNNFEAAVSDYGRSIEAYRAALDLGGANQAVADGMATALWSRGNTLFELDRLQDASADYASAIQLVEIVVARDPNDTAAARRLAILRGSNAMALASQGRKDEAVREMSRTNSWFEAQAAADPDTPGTQRSLAVSYHMMGDVYAATGDNLEACRWYRRTLGIWEAIDDKFGISDFDTGQPDVVRGLLTECRS